MDEPRTLAGKLGWGVVNFLGPVLIFGFGLGVLWLLSLFGAVKSNDSGTTTRPASESRPFVTDVYGGSSSISDADYGTPSYETNDQGCPKNQYVSGYYRSDGTYVHGYSRNSPTDGCGGG